MRSPALVLLFGFSLILGFRSAALVSQDEIAEAWSTTYVKPFTFVLCQTNASSHLIRLAREISSTYGLREPAQVSGNPMCCVWLEIKPSPSNPGVPYFSVTVEKAGETWLYASSEELLEKAVNRLKESARRQSGQLVVPVGQFSYYTK